MTYEVLRGLKPEDYQHPGEKTAMTILKNIPLADELVKQIVDLNVQTQLLSDIVGDHFRITEKTNPRVYGLYKLALRRLDMPKEYPLYCELGYDFNGGTAGVDKPFIILNSSMISALTDDELLFVIGHELGHIKSGHQLYKNMGKMAVNMIRKAGKLGNAAGVALYYTMMEWFRNAEFTCDRAGLLASGNIDAAYTMTMKLMGKSADIPFIDFSVEEVLKQEADLHEASSHLIGKVLYVGATAIQSHPWGILRLKQINEWYQSGAFEELVSKYS